MLSNGCRRYGVALLSAALGACAMHAPPASAPANSAATGYARGVKDDAHEFALTTRRLDVDVAVRGAIAETEMTLSIVAPAGTSAPIEGRLHVDLPHGAIVTGYALDVSGGLVDGSLVDEPKARSAYERQVRQQVDPGLATIDQAGGFNTRIFPIDAEHGRRVRLRFVAPVDGDLRLPIALPDKGSEFSVRIRQPGVRNPPRASLDGVQIRSSAGIAEGTATGPVVGTLRVAPPPMRDSIASKHSSGEEYWQLSGRLPAATRIGGGVLRVYWDRSRSRRDGDHAAELARIREAISALHPTIIQWVDFSSGQPSRTVLSGDAELERHVGEVRYGGATDFSILSGEAPATTCLFVSDGRSTFGDSTPSRLPCRLFAIGGKGANAVLLQQMADAGGGRLISGPTNAADWLQPSVSGVRANGQRVEFMSLPAPSGFWRIAIAAPTAGPVVVDVAGTEVARYGESSATAFNGEAELMGASRLALLGETTDRKKFVELSRRYSIASPSLAFVVLERPEDYVRYDIAPPANYTRRDEWTQLAAEAAEDKAEANSKRFDALLKDWQAQVAWWEKKFDINAKPKAPDGPKAESLRRVPVAAPSPVVLPMAPPPPPPVAERVADVGETGDIIVTGSRVPAPNDVQISVSAWRPDRDYLNAFDADPAAFESVFPEWEKKAGDVPSFYLDTADWLHRKGKKDLAVETLLSALDLPVANEVTLGMVAARLERYGAIDAAVALREKHAALDVDHPQPRRLLALALTKRASLGGTGARADLERAIALLTDIAVKPLDTRWDGIDLISLVEANALLPKLRGLGGTIALDPRLTKNLDSDVRVVLDWSNDAADIDLWVDEPNGERAIYNYPRTLIGGHLSDDMTSGFGPEEYFLRRAATGRYTVRANVYSPDRLDPNGMSRVTAHLFRDWGRPTQREESIDLDLKRGQNGEVRIGTLKVGVK